MFSNGIALNLVVNGGNVSGFMPWEIPRNPINNTDGTNGTLPDATCDLGNPKNPVTGVRAPPADGNITACLANAKAVSRSNILQKNSVIGCW